MSWIDFHPHSIFIASSSVTRELPGELPYGIIHRIITHFVQNWQAVAMKGFKDVKDFAIQHFNVLVSAHFADYEPGGLLSKIK